MDDLHERTKLAQARVGTLVGKKFALQKLLGIGGMAAVYAARHRNGHRVALKILHGSLQTSHRQRARLLREAYVANAVAHSGAVRIFDDGIDPEAGAYLVMELLEGATLAELHKRAPGGLPLPLVVALADQLLDVLAAAHARGIVHRDIKPGNLFVTEAGVLKVLDFGIARMMERLTGNTIETQQGAMLGTPAFMPQEQARGRWEEVDARSDLWAVGATVFTLTSGAYVHEAETPNEQLGLAMTTAARSLASVAPHLAERLVRVVDRALRYDPGERWQDARSMQAALRALDVGEVAAGALQPFLDTERATSKDGSLTEGSLLPIEALNGAGVARSWMRAVGLVLIAAALAMLVLVRAGSFRTAAPVAKSAPAPRAQASASRADTEPREVAAPHTVAALHAVSLASGPAAVEPKLSQRRTRPKPRATIPPSAGASENDAGLPHELLDLRY